MQDVASHDKFLGLAQHALFIPAVRVGRRDEKASKQRGADHGNRTYVYGLKFAFHLPIRRAAP